MEWKKRESEKDSTFQRELEDIGGEPLDGSGFENETPDEGFSGAVALPSTDASQSIKCHICDQPISMMDLHESAAIPHIRGA